MAKFELKLGPSRLVLDSSLLSIKNIRRLDRELDIATGEFLDTINNKLKQLNELNENYREIFTQKDEESDEQYQERIKPVQEEINEKSKQIVGEDGIDSILPLAYSSLKIFAGLDNQDSKVTPENFDSATRDDIDTFILDFCSKGKLKFKNIYQELTKNE